MIFNPNELDMVMMLMVDHQLNKTVSNVTNVYKVISSSISLLSLKGECSVLEKKIILWMKTIHYPNTIRSHLVTIVPMAPFTQKSTSKLRSALHFRYSKVIRRFISRANTAQT